MGFEADKATVKLLLRDAYALGDRFEKHLGGIYERFIDDIETFIVAAQERGQVVSAPARMVAYTLAALVGQLAHRRLSTDDDVTAAQVADFVVALVLMGCVRGAPNRPLEGTGKLERNHRLYCAGAHLPSSAPLELVKTCGRA
jgi:hypothetical protein